MSRIKTKIFPCNFPEECLKGLNYSRDLFTDEFIVENPPDSLNDLLILVLLGDDSEYHCMDNKDG